jgi:hypothetical protein
VAILILKMLSFSGQHHIEKWLSIEQQKPFAPAHTAIFGSHLQPL